MLPVFVIVKVKDEYGVVPVLPSFRVTSLIANVGGAGVGVAVGVDVGVDVGVAVGVFVGVAVGVFVGVAVGVFVGVAVGVLVGVAVGVFVGVAVGVFVGVLVGVAVGVGVAHDEEIRSEKRLKLPVSPAAASLTFKVHTPFASWPSNALSGLLGEKFPATGAPAKFSIAGNPPSSSTVAEAKLLPLLPKVLAGTPIRSIKVTVVPPGDVSLNTRSPIQL